MADTLSPFTVSRGSPATLTSSSGLLRRIDNNKVKTKFQLNEPFRRWEPATGLRKISDFRDALNRIVHATSFTVGFERLPDDSHKLSAGAIGVIWLETVTDQRERALLDVFSLASCFLHQVLPALMPTPPQQPDPTPIH